MNKQTKLKNTQVSGSKGKGNLATPIPTWEYTYEEEFGHLAIPNTIKQFIKVLLKQKDMERIVELAAQASNYEQKMTAYRAELIEKLNKGRISHKNVEYSPFADGYNQAIDRAIQIIKLGGKDES